jgi:hypothetical protein
MANLSADAPLRFLGDTYTEKFNVDSAAARTIYKGEPVILNASLDTTHVVSQAVEALVDGDVFVGIAAAKFTNALGDSEDGPSSKVEVYVGPTIVGFKSAVFTEADLGKTVYMSDTGTLGAANGAFALIGKLHRVLDGYAYVALSTPAVVDVP